MASGSQGSRSPETYGVGGCSDAIPAEGDCSSLGLQPPTRPSCPRVAGAREGRANLWALSGAPEVARETLNFTHLVPCHTPPTLASAHPSSTITPTHGLAPGSQAGSRGFPPETERLLPLQSSQLPGTLRRPVSPTEHLGSLPSSPRVRVRERHPHTTPEPGTRPCPTSTLTQHKQAGSPPLQLHVDNPGCPIGGTRGITPPAPPTPTPATRPHKGHPEI